jgi:MYXO-CTERM domain-containing protein
MAAALVVAAGLTAPGVASAAVYYYVEWSAADVAHGTASGTITLPDAGTVSVGFVALTADGGAGNLYGAQINGTGTNYWIPSAPYISTEVENPPPDPDILQLSGGQNETYRVTLSEPIKDPIMAIVSLGQAGVPTTYVFDSPFTIVSQGTGYWGGTSTSLVELDGGVLQGTEGHGTIQFIGTFSTFSWTVPTPESWHGFTFGIRTTEALEPDDGGDEAGDAGEVDATAAEASEPDAGEVDAGEVDATVPDAANDAGVVLHDAAASDSGAPPDATAAPDATPAIDASAPAIDASAANDASAPRDAAAAHDAASYPAPDAAAYDAGVSTPSNDSNGWCNCAAVGRSAGHGATPIAAAIALGAIFARRRRRQGRSGHAGAEAGGRRARRP